MFQKEEEKKEKKKKIVYNITIYYIWLVSVDSVFSPEKNDTKISHVKLSSSYSRPGGGGGGNCYWKVDTMLVKKKHVKRVVIYGRAMYARTVERVSKLPKFGKKGILNFQQSSSIRVWGIYFTNHEKEWKYTFRYAFRVWSCVVSSSPKIGWCC